MTQQITIEGRLVQGGVTLRPAKDQKGDPKKDKDGNQISECYMGIAVPKNSPNLAAYWAAFDKQARESFPHLFPNGGACTHPRFAMKWQDGDGVDNNGKSVADHEGFPGHWIIKCTTRYAPSCYERNSHGQLVQLTDPEKVIKRGYYVAVSLTIDGNGVEPGNSQAVPGLFVSPTLVLYTAPGQEIVSGPDPNAAFAGVNAQPSQSGGAGVATGPALPGAPAPSAGPALPPAPSAGPALPPAPSAGPVAPAAPAAGPVAPAAPAAGPVLPLPPAMPGAGPVAPPARQYIMQPSAQGASREALLGAGWTDDQLVAAGHMVIQ